VPRKTAARPVGRRLTVVLIAEEAAGVRLIKLLASTEHRVAAVMSAAPEALTHAAEQDSAPVSWWPSELVRDPAFSERLVDEEVDLLLNVHSLFIVHPVVLAAPRIGSFNLHPGPLPDYAGLNAPSWAIYCGEMRHGVTLHRMVPELDAGPIAYEARFDIEDRDTGGTLMAKCVRHGLPLISRLLDTCAVDPDAVPAILQDPTRRRYFGREVPHGGAVPWWLPARRVVDFVRACDYAPFPSPWGTPTASLGDRRVAVTRAARTGERAGAPPGMVGHTDHRGARVATADEWVEAKLVPLGDESGPAVAPGQRFEVS
jgi:methionyl-tRNA formyltransferase